MSTSRYVNYICIAGLISALLITILLMNGSRFGITCAEQTVGYENRLFSSDTVHTIDIVMDNWESFIEECETEEYSPCTVLIDGEKYSNIGIRAKGNTSLSNVKAMGSQRYSFKLEFDQYEDGKSYYGLDKLCLNNLIQDNTMMKDYLVYQMMKDFGVDSPLCSYVYIKVNGEDWGLYLAVEGVEESFLTRNYGSEYGDLYKPDSISLGGGRGMGRDFDMKQFNFDGEAPSFSAEENTDRENPPFQAEENTDGKMPQPPGQEDIGEQKFDKSRPQMPGTEDSDKKAFDERREQRPEEFGGMGSDDVKLKYIDDNPDSYTNIFDSAKTSVSDADKKRLIASLKNLSEYNNLEETLDIDEVLRYFVVHNFVVNGDSYTGSMIHNYYLHEQNGQLAMIPWDYNLAFGTFQAKDTSESVNASIDNPVSGGDSDDRPMLGFIFSDAEYTEQYHDLFSEFLAEWLDNGKLVSMIENVSALIRSYVEKDPTRFCSTEEFEKAITSISQYVSLRGEAVSRQLEGDDTPVETGELNIADMGTMNHMDKEGGFQKEQREHK